MLGWLTMTIGLILSRFLLRNAPVVSDGHNKPNPHIACPDPLQNDQQVVTQWW